MAVPTFPVALLSVLSECAAYSFGTVVSINLGGLAGYFLEILVESRFRLKATLQAQGIKVQVPKRQ